MCCILVSWRVPVGSYLLLCARNNNISLYFFTVFQQKAARRQSDGDKFHGPRKQGTNTNVSLFNCLQGRVKEEL